MKVRISIVLAIVMVALVTVAAFATGIVSPPTPKEENPVSAWAMEAIVKAGEENILEQTRTYVFRDPITREGFCELIYNLIQNTLSDDLLAIDYALRTDIADTENVKVLELYAMGIVNGKTPTAFFPNDTLTREEAATIIGRTAKEAIPIPMHSVYYEFKDGKEISDWAMVGVQTACNMGVMKGTGDGNFSPEGIFTVEEAITALMRIFDTYKANEEFLPVSGLSFADNMNQQMPQDKNYMFSPLSIKMALAMAANGASGETMREILNTIGTSDLETYNKHIETLIETYSQSELLKLTVANSIWLNSDQTTQHFSKEYEKKARDIFGAEIDMVDHQNANKKINGWVNEKTNGKIPTIINKDNENFWAMLVNAVYFRGRWQSEFAEHATKEDHFTDRNGKESTIHFMNKQSWMPYAAIEGVDIIELPYLTREDVISEEGEYIETKKLEGMDISMYLMMSDYRFNPEYILNQAEFNSKYIALSIPKFNIEYSTNIMPILQSLGMNKPFEKTAEFENMFDNGNMWIDSAIHKTYIKVDESGTEAAAVTAIGMAGSALPPKPMELKYNKPFTFVIQDNINGEILFMGEYAFVE